MFHIPAHKNVTHPAAQVRPNEPRDELAKGGATALFLATLAFAGVGGLLTTAGLAIHTLVS